MKRTILSFFKNRKLTSSIFLLFVTLYAVHSGLIVFDTLYNTIQRVTDENIFAGDSSKIVVQSVIPDGASDRAGMMVGDTIIAINGQTFRNSGHADRILRSAKVGSYMDYKIIRGDKELILKVQAAQQKLRLRHLIFLLVTLVMITLGLYIAYLKHEYIQSRYLSFIFICLAPITMFMPGNSITGSNLLGITIVFISSYHIAIPLMLRFSYFFPIHSEPIWKKRRYFIYLINIFSFISATSVIAYYALNKTLNLARIFSPPYESLLDLIITFGYLIYLTLLFIAFVLHVLIKPLKTHFSQKYLRISWAIFASSVFLGTYSIINNFPLGDLFYLGLLAVPITYMYIVSKTKIFGSILVVKKSYRYISLFAFCIFLFFTLYLYVLKFISEQEYNLLKLRINFASIEFTTEPLEGFSDRPLIMFAGIAVTLLFGFIFIQLKKFLDHLFAKQKYNYKDLISELTEIFTSRYQDNLTFYKQINQFIFKSVRIKGVALFLNEKNTHIYWDSLGFTTDFQSILKSLKLHNTHLSIDTFKLLANDRNNECHHILPIKIKGESLGFFILGEKESEEPFNDLDIEFFATVTHQFAISLENNRLQEEHISHEFMKRDIEVAKKIQLNMLPHDTPRFNTLTINGYYKAAKDVGGDYYDYLHTPNTQKISIVVGDVSGKGVSASLYMSRFQGIMRSLYFSGIQEPKQLLEQMNKTIYKDIDKNAFVTCIFSEFDVENKTFRMARAGHSPMLHFSSSKQKFNSVQSSGLGLGIASEAVFNEHLSIYQSPYEKGDVFVLYSDGISEAMNEKREEYGDERLKMFIAKYHSLSSKEIETKLQQEISIFVGKTDPHDDITFVILKAT